MINSALGLVDKMRIEVYDSSGYNRINKTIFVQLNPDKYNLSQTVIYDEEQAIGASANNLRLNRIESPKVTFEFLFDSTGVVPPGKIQEGKGTPSLLENALGNIGTGNPLQSYMGKSISKDLEDFKNLLMGYNGSTHDVPYLHLIWGGYNLKCRLTSIDVQYYLFNNSGMPLRAKATCAFQGTATYELMLAEQQKSSPDMTHERVFKMGDKVTIMAENIYESPNYYIDVAKSNSLLSFRKVPVGTKLIFPPIK